VALALLADDEGSPMSNHILIERSPVATSVNNPYTTSLYCLGHCRHGGLYLGIFAHKIRRTLGIKRVVERHDGIILILYPDYLA
jgi:hypothetical protein